MPLYHEISEYDLFERNSFFDTLFEHLGSYLVEDCYFFLTAANDLGVKIYVDGDRVWIEDPRNPDENSDDLWVTVSERRDSIEREWCDEFVASCLNYLRSKGASGYSDNPQSADNECSSPLECPWTWYSDERYWCLDPVAAGQSWANHLIKNGDVPLD